MSLDTHSSLATYLPTTVRHSNPHEVMFPTTTKFIGAVEDEWQLFSDRAEDYTIGSAIGFGASSIVYAAEYHPVSENGLTDNLSKGIPCALKVLDLDSLPVRSLHLLQRETTLMSLSKHPNVLRVRGSWMSGHKLYIALRLMNKGSAADVVRYGWPGGMEQDVVRCILAQALKGLNYLHINGFIHRDIKAANLLIDDDGTVLLGDLGVAADLAEDTSHTSTTVLGSRSELTITSSAGLTQLNSSATSSTHSGSSRKPGALSTSVPIRPRMGKRKSFVGTPCWMAPELIQGKQYDAKADIWSFGITALELTQGRPPRFREKPQQVLLRTVQDDPPTLDREGGTYRYSRAFKEVVDWCLNKDPAKRPSAEELLQTPFFKGPKKKSYLINTILKDLPPLTQRQERREIAPVKSASSIDSWDFATTVHSPPTLHRTRFSSGHEGTINGVFVMDEEEECDPPSAQRTGFTISNPERDTLEIGIGALPPSPVTSNSSLHGSGLDDSPSSLPSTSAPSSYTDSSDLVRLQSNKSFINNEILASITEPADVASRNPPTLRQSVSVPRKLSPSWSSSEPGIRLNLWQKFKANVKGSPSSNGLSSNQPYESHAEGRKNKGLLSRSPSIRS